MTAPASALPPAGDVDAAEFWDALHRGVLLVSVCTACANRWLPPLATCPRCSSRAVTSEPAGGLGTLYSWTVVHRAADPAYAEETPYVVGLVTLDGGARIYGRVVGIDPSALHADQPLRLEIVDRDDTPTWHFVAAPE
jgi:uncharacterized OB-fold protein